MKQNLTHDYLIAGFGIAGALLANELEKRGYRVLVVHDGDKNVSSHLAAGIINPVTGRRFVKTWLYEHLRNQLLESYGQLEKVFGKRYLHPVRIMRMLNSVKQENDVSARLSDPDYTQYLKLRIADEVLPNGMHSEFMVGETLNAFRLDMGILVDNLASKYVDSGNLIYESLCYDDIRVNEKYIVYREYSAKKLIFSEGVKAINNPYFSYLPFEPSKGEILLMRIPGLGRTVLYKNRIFIAPFRDDLYWIGSWYENFAANDNPTVPGLDRLLAEFKNMYTGSFQIVKHLAAFRPTVKDRRPLLGIHPKHSSLAIFNGLGTKGASLGPFMAKHFCDFLESGERLLEEVNIERYLSHYS